MTTPIRGNYVHFVLAGQHHIGALVDAVLADGIINVQVDAGAYVASRAIYENSVYDASATQDQSWHWPSDG